MNPTRQNINPFLLRETSTHHPVSQISKLLSMLTLAEEGDLIAQYELFSDMEERDAHIFSEMNKRKLAVSQLDWMLQTPKDAGSREKKDALNIESMIKDKLDVDTLVFDLADAIGKGFIAIEIEWARLPNGLWFPIKLTPRPQRWFTVDIETRMEIRLRSINSANGDELIPYGWVLHQHSSKTGYPATQGLYRALALPYLFKNFATKNWLRFCELYGTPIRVLFSNEKDKARKTELINALINMGANGVALLSGGMQEDLKTVEAVKGDGIGLQNLIDWCERSVSKAILGGTLTSDTGKNGNYATATIHDDVRYQIRDFDAKQIASTLTFKLIGSIIKLNGLAIRASWAFDTQEPEDLELYADAIPKLVNVGAKIPVSYLHTKLKIPLAQKDEEILSSTTAETQKKNPDITGQLQNHDLVTLAGKSTVFTPEQQVIEDLADQTLNVLDSPISTELIASAIRAAKSPEDLEVRLAAILQNTDMTEFNQVLEKALFAADVIGYVHAD